MPGPLGRHMPLAGRPQQALTIAQELGCQTIQIFVSSPRTWAPPATSARETEVWRTALAASGFAPIVIHAAYLINLASSNDETRAKSQSLLRWTLARAAEIGASEVVLHIGSHGGAGMDMGMARLMEGLTAVGADAPANVHLLLENDVGAGNTIGADFATLAQSLAGARAVWGERVGVCIDTAHLWGAGHDIGTPDAARATLDAMEAAFGLAQVRVIHLNDTATKLGGHRDLHARLGEGIIGEDGLRAFLQDARLSQAAIILETPIKLREGTEEHDWQDDRTRVAYARNLLTNLEIS